LQDQAYITQGTLSKAAPGVAGKAQFAIELYLKSPAMTAKQKRPCQRRQQTVEQVDTFLHFL
jgi:hypothetical protein